jgi:lipopolysaccharide transport system ATP-binding protein
MLSPAMRSGRRAGGTRWALREVSFAIPPGHTFGVIGHNGAGKSTLLRLASGLSLPTKGSFRVTSSVASVLTLGATFQGDLSGEANAITAAIIGGMAPREARARLSQAIEFAELEGFEEAPVRSYSDGMKLRLAFGVLTLTRPDLLIIDEVVAVGDLNFQRKCMDYIADIRKAGTAVVMASHDLLQIASECDQVMLLEHGRVRTMGTPEEVIEEYRASADRETRALTPTDLDETDNNPNLKLGESRFGSQAVRIERVSVNGLVEPGIVSGQGAEVRVTLGPSKSERRVIIEIGVYRKADDLKCLELNTEMDDIRVSALPDESTEVTLGLDPLELSPGEYVLDVGVFPTDWSHALDYHWHAHTLSVSGGAGDDQLPVYRPRHRGWRVVQTSGL